MELRTITCKTRFSRKSSNHNIWYLRFSFFHKKVIFEHLFERIIGLNNNYPKVEYSEAGILHDTKNILYQNFVERYCKQMQETLMIKDPEKIKEGISLLVQPSNVNPILF
jgi:hypothetical protein